MVYLMIIRVSTSSKQTATRQAKWFEKRSCKEEKEMVRYRRKAYSKP